MGNTANLPLIIDGDALNSTRSLDFEAQSSWNITVRTVDSGYPALSLIKTFQISVVGKLKLAVMLHYFCFEEDSFEVFTKAILKEMKAEDKLIYKSSYNLLVGPVVQTPPDSANPGLNFNQGFFLFF